MRNSMFGATAHAAPLSAVMIVAASSIRRLPSPSEIGPMISWPIPRPAMKVVSVS